jgi:hypothetical protein
MTPPIAIYYADWGSSPKKRWLARAVLERGHYVAHPPAPVGEHKALVQRIRAEIAGDAALVGFDFPIGIPGSYARLIGVTQFKFFCSASAAVSGRSSSMHADIHRKSLHHVPSTHRGPNARSTPTSSLDWVRPRSMTFEGRARGHMTAEKAACPLFWTLGANQVGKAAISGWWDVLIPALRGNSRPLLWPFDGSLDDLLKPGNLIIAETYPAEYCGWLFHEAINGKGKLEVRKRAGSDKLQWADDAEVLLDSDLKDMIALGFPNDDAFDATVGLFGMLEVVLGMEAER